MRVAVHELGHDYPQGMIFSNGGLLLTIPCYIPEHERNFMFSQQFNTLIP